MPRLRFPGFEGEWSERILGDCLSVCCKRNKGRFTKNDVLSVSGEFGIVNQIAFQGRSFAGESIAGYKIVSPGLIVYTKSPLREAPYGIVKVSRTENGIVSPLYGVYSASDNIDPCFIEFYFANALRRNRYFKPLVNLGPKHTMCISDKSALNGTIVLPPQKEQGVICGFLDTLDSRIAAQRKLVELLKKHKRGFIEQIFGHDNTDWNRCQLGDIATINPSTGTLPSKFYYIDLESVSDGVWGRRTLVRREDAPSRAQRNVAREDILFQTVRPYQQNNYFVECELDKPIVASTGYAQIRTSEEPLFVYWMLHSPSFLREVMLRCTGSGYPAVNAADLAKIVVAVPNRADQRRYATLITQIAKRCNAEEAIVSLLERSKRGLLQQLFV